MAIINREWHNIHSNHEYIYIIVKNREAKIRDRMLVDSKHSASFDICRDRLIEFIDRIQAR